MLASGKLSCATITDAIGGGVSVGGEGEREVYMTLDPLSLYSHIIKNVHVYRRRRRVEEEEEKEKNERKKKVHLLVLQSLESHVLNSRGSTQLSPSK